MVLALKESDKFRENLLRNKSNRESDIPQAKKECIEGQLQTQLGADYQVVNHAFDGFTTSHVLNGCDVGAVLRYNRNYLNARGESGTVKPLDKLRDSINEHSSDTHYVVISVGGNDFREHLMMPWKLFTAISGVQKRYLQIVDQVQGMGGENIKPILMFQYRTDARNRPYRIYSILGILGYIAATLNTLAVRVIVFSAFRLMTSKVGRAVGFGKLFLGVAFLYASHKQLSLRVTKEIFTGKHEGIAVFGAFLERLYAPIIERALEKDIPILDLSNFFDPKEPKNYISEIEPSASGGMFIAIHLSTLVKGYESQQQNMRSIFENWRVQTL